MEHNITLTKRQDLQITGIKKIKSTEPNQVIAILENNTLVITGLNLSPELIDITQGILNIKGTINSIKYSNASKSFSLRNIFK